MGDDLAVEVSNVSKSFRIYSEQNKSLKAALLRRNRARFEQFWALKDVSLNVRQGTTFGLLGNNGSGKSTLLKCIARILEPNQGAITHHGRMAAMLEVGSGFHPELSGRENIYLNSAILGMSRSEIERKFDSIVDFAGEAVARSIDQPVKNYSSGMYVRLGFSVSIHVEPDILLVDEVLAVGDMSFQEKCMDKFAELKRDGRTVIVVSHGLEQMRTFCDDAAWLDSGRIVGACPVNDVINNYFEDEHHAHPARGGGMRFGSGEVLIDWLELITPDGRDPSVIRSGEPLTIRMHFMAKERIEDPSFIVSIEQIEGQTMWAQHTKEADFLPADIVPGPGSIDVVIPRLALRPGTFHVSGSVHTRDGGVLDAMARSVKFNVIDGAIREAGGIVALGSHWENLEPPRRMRTVTELEVENEAVRLERVRVHEESNAALDHRS